MTSFDLIIFSISSKIEYNNVLKVNFKSFEGELTILANHCPIMGLIKKGNIKINDDINVSVNEGVYYFENNILKIIENKDSNLSDEEDVKFIIKEKKICSNYKNNKYFSSEISIKKIIKGLN